MGNKIIQKFKVNRALAILTIVLGIILIVYMITVEDEPGALPLLLIVSGTIWLLTIQFRKRRYLRKE